MILLLDTALLVSLERHRRAGQALMMAPSTSSDLQPAGRMSPSCPCPSSGALTSHCQETFMRRLLQQWPEQYQLQSLALSKQRKREYLLDPRLFHDHVHAFFSIDYLRDPQISRKTQQHISMVATE